MKIREYLYHRRGRYIIEATLRGKKVYVAGSKDYDKIQNIYEKCCRVHWQYDAVHEIKQKHSKWQNPAKYISEKQGKYILCLPNVRSETDYCGSYDTLDEAIRVRDELLHGNLDAMDAKPYKPRPRGKQNPHRYVYPVKGNEDKYYVAKLIDGEVVRFGTFNSLDDAVAERDFLEIHEWDINCYDLV